MKNSICLFYILLSVATAFSGTPATDYPLRFTPTVKNEKLKNISFVSQISPDLWKQIGLMEKDREELENLRKADSAKGYYLAPNEYAYNRIVDLIGVELQVQVNGKLMRVVSTGNKFTTEQKYLLSRVDIGSDLGLKITYKYKTTNENLKENRQVTGGLKITVVPETEAEFKGGNNKLREYLKKNILDVIEHSGKANITGNPILSFKVKEDGKISALQAANPSKNPLIDQLIMNAINNMPDWKPAKNSKGTCIEQQFNIPLLGGGC